MRIGIAIPLSAVLGLAACGGSDAPPSGPPLNAFTGVIFVSGTMPTGTTNCLTTSQVVFTATTVDTHTVPINAGDCVAFFNNDASAHRVANNSQSSCNELTSGTTIAAGNTFAAGPFTGPKSCGWQDTTHPPTTGGGGGGGGGGY